MEVKTELLNALRNNKRKKTTLCLSIAPEIAEMIDEQVKNLKCTKTYYFESLVLAQYESSKQNAKTFAMTVKAINKYMKGAV